MAAKKTGTKTKIVYKAKKAKARAKRGFAGFGKGMSIKSWGIGSIGLVLIKKLIGSNSMVGVDIGDYNAPVQKIVVGGVAGLAGLDNADLVSAGIKELTATAIDNFTAGRGIFGGMMPLGEIGGVGL